MAAHRWPTTAAVALVLGLLAWWARRSSVDFPVLQDPVPARALIGIGVGIVVQLPLYSSFPELEPTLAREPRVRLLRVTAVLALVGLATAPAWVATADDSRWSANLVLAALLTALGVVAVVVVGDLGWTAPMALGLVAIVTDVGPLYPVSRVLAAVPAVVVVLALGAAAAVYVRRGPRR
ncbi:MAG: hypothetical protein ACTHLJ_14570 [Angustibacter sp.]